ncbi:MAG: hypothetical protein ACUVWR_00425 [Anaerolineae bacterium]
MELDLSQRTDGKVLLGGLVLQWIVHSEGQPFRLVDFALATCGSRVQLLSNRGEGWDGSISTAISAEIDITISPGSLDFQVQAHHPDKVRVVKTVVQGLPDGLLRTIGANGTRRIGARHRPVEYPCEWPTPVVWLQPTDSTKDRFVARCVSQPIARKAFSARWRPSGDTELVLYEEAHAPKYGADFTGSLWHLACTRSVIGELDAHGRELGQVRGLLPFEERQDVPPWVKRCDLVVKLHGMDFNGLVHLDYEGMAQALRTLARYGDLHHALVYIAGWDGAYMRDCPGLRPSERLGGASGFSHLVATAHSLGAKVALHFDPIAASAARAGREGLMAYQAIGLGGEPVMYPALDINNDGFVESGWLFMNPWFSGYRRKLIGSCREVIERYQVDGFYLADMHLYVGDSRGDVFAGWQALVSELREVRSDLVLVGEGCADYIACLTPLFEPLCRADAPEFQLTLGRWGRSIAYSGVADARNRAGARELIYAQYRPLKGVSRNVLPSLVIARQTLASDMRDVLSALEWARNWEALYGEDALPVSSERGAA